jgi:hypothetical protein
LGKNPDEEWHTRALAGESYKKIAEKEGVKLGVVSSAVNRYRRKMGLSRPKGERARARAKADNPIYTDYDALTAALDAFDAILERKGCRHIQGDIRDGSAVFCDRPAALGLACCEEHAKIWYTEKPKPLQVPA